MMQSARPPSDLKSLSALLLAEPAAERPLEMWNPPDCGMMDLTIAANGTWIHAGSPITRPQLVKLFASILWREEHRYFLKTPVEKIGIHVEDLPFLAVEMQAAHESGQTTLIFRTNTDDVICAGPDHALILTQEPDGTARPALHVRRNLYARISRPLYYELVNRGETSVLDGTPWFGVWSGGCFFPMIEADALELA
jgi:hypothetical protein